MWVSPKNRHGLSLGGGADSWLAAFTGETEDEKKKKKTPGGKMWDSVANAHENTQIPR